MVATVTLTDLGICLKTCLSQTSGAYWILQDYRLPLGSKMQEENLGLKTEDKGTKEGKWDADQICTA